MPLVELHQLSFSYGHTPALRDLNLTLEPGTIGLVGNNGAGKSTLLKVLLGQLRPQAGHGRLLDCEIGHQNRHLRGRIGYMPEAAAIVPLLRGVEFVALSGELYGMSRRDARRRAHEVLNYIGLGELRYRRLDEYSVGNLQRLKLGAALVHDPQLLLLDEPTNGLDPEGRTAMLELLNDLVAETGKSLILCSHLLGDVERLCDQVVVMHAGSAVRAGRLAELRGAGSDRFLVTWQGDGPFLAALAAAGVECLPGPSPEARETRARVPAEWSSRRWFEIARDAGVVLTRLTLEEENLEQLFFRMTRPAAPSPQNHEPTPA
jgi:ABC-2 type transport system ATP-binding protein